MEKTLTTSLDESKKQFGLVMQEAMSLDIVNNVAGAFDAASIIVRLKEVMSDEVMKAVFMPLQGQKIGFRTDKTYPVDVVRTCVIDAAANGLKPVGNQFNIIAGNMYPTKEGYTALLANMKNTSMQLRYLFEFDHETVAKSADPSYVAIPCRVSYKTSREDMKGVFKYVAMVKSNGATSTTDQLRGKAERKCKKAFYEFLTGIDLGDGDADTVDTTYVDVTPKTANQKAKEVMERMRARKAEQMSEDEVEKGLEAAAAEINFNAEGGQR